MLKIRDEHIDSLAARQVSGFTARMMVHLREVFAAEVARLDDARLQALIARVVAQGEDWGVTKEPLVERLIELFVSFEELRRNPLPQWISEIVTRPRRNGARVLVRTENGLCFQDGPMAEGSGEEAVGATFYRRVDQAFYSEVKQENGGALPPDLTDANGNARSLTISPADRAYRKKWKAIAAQMRRSCAIPRKSVKSASIPWPARTSGVKFPSVFLPSMGGASTEVLLKWRHASWHPN